MKSYKLEKYITKAGKQKGRLRWRIRASNGKIVAISGEGYVRRIDMDNEIKAIRDFLVNTEFL